jgi:hypothetical protein
MRNAATGEVTRHQTMALPMAWLIKK